MKNTGDQVCQFESWRGSRGEGRESEGLLKNKSHTSDKDQSIQKTVGEKVGEKKDYLVGLRP